MPVQPGTLETRSSSQLLRASFPLQPSPATSRSAAPLLSLAGRCSAHRKVPTWAAPDVTGQENQPRSALEAEAAQQAWGRGCPALPGTLRHRWQVTRNKNPRWNLSALFRHSK